MKKLVVGVLAISGMSSVIAANVGMPFSAGLLVGKASLYIKWSTCGQRHCCGRSFGVCLVRYMDV